MYKKTKSENNNCGDIMFISIIRTLILYAFVIFTLRIMGKRQISEMQPSELVVTLIMSEIIALPMQNTSQPLLSGIIPVIVLVALEIAASAVMMKSRKIRKLICGNPVVVISDGKILQEQMRRLRMTTEDLCAQIRQQGVFSIDDVQYCIVETNGTVSVLEKPQCRVPTAEDLGVEIEDNKFGAIVISDGEFIEERLELFGKKKSEVNNILNKNNIEIDDVFIMTLDGLGKYNIIQKED